MALQWSAFLATTVARVLREPAVGKIAFQYKNFLVTGMRLSVVADLVMRGRISCVWGTFHDPDFDSPSIYRVAAMYVPTAGGQGGLLPNQMVFPREDFGDYRAQDKFGTPSVDPPKVHERVVIVHEAVHALHDRFLAPPTINVLAREDEAVSVLAEAIYMEAAGISPIGALLIGGSMESALALVRKKSLATSSQTVVLTDSEMAPIIAGAAREWKLEGGRAGIMSTYDGIPDR